MLAGLTLRSFLAKELLKMTTRNILFEPLVGGRLLDDYGAGLPGVGIVDLIGVEL
jgi:hypothetical protein